MNADAGTEPAGTGAAAVQSFYGRWAGAYDLLATRTPGIAGLRARAADALELAPGDTVLEVGCGTGANLPYLRERVGARGRVVGVDLTGPLLDRARRRTRSRSNVHVVRGDATALPVDEPVDAVLGTFVTGMLDDPAAAVGGWANRVAAGGRLCLLDGTSSPHAWAYPVTLAFRAFVSLGAPPESRAGAQPVTRALDRRVAAAHGALAARSAGVREERHALGFLRLTAGRVEGT